MPVRTAYPAIPVEKAPNPEIVNAALPLIVEPNIVNDSSANIATPSPAPNVPAKPIPAPAIAPPNDFPK